MTEAVSPWSKRKRDATIAEILRTSRELLTDGEDISLRAVAGRMGMTAPALYRYVGSYQELRDLTAIEIDKSVAELCVAAADAQPSGDAPARLVAALVEFRQWAHRHPREFHVAFSSAVGYTSSIRRDIVTSNISSHLMTDLIFEVWQQIRFPVPSLKDLPISVQESITDPTIPAKIDRVPAEALGLVWIYQVGWTQLYGVVALEVAGHMDPRVIASGEMYLDVFRRFAPSLGLTDDLPRLEVVIRDRLDHN